jgi:predicted Zn finger-like uncharacterized protein
MEAQCPSCKARYRVKLETVPEAGLKVVCPKCKSPFFINPESQPAKEQPPQQDSFVLETVAEPNQGPTPVRPMSGKGDWLGWILGGFFCLAGFGMLFQYHFLSAIFYLAAALILIPPLAEKLNLSLSGKVKALVVLGCVLGAGYFMSLDSKKTAHSPGARKAASESEQKPDFLKASEAKPVEAEKPPSAIASRAASPEGIGVSYGQVVAHLENEIKMTKSSRVRGEYRYMGSTADNLAILEIIGAKENISQTTLIIGLPNDSKTVVTRNTALYLQFLKNTVPEWPGVTDWANSALKRFASSSETSAEISHGNKAISLELLKPTTMLSVMVKRK